MTFKALLELPLKLIHKTEKRRGKSWFRGFPRHSHGMLDQVLIDTLGRCVNGLSNHPTLRQEIVSRIQKGTPLLAGFAYGSQYLKSLIAEHGISRAQGSWEDVNFRRTKERFNQIDMRYIDLDGSLKRLYAMVTSSDSLEAKPWSFPALLCPSASVKVDSVFIGNTVTDPIRNRISYLT